MKLALSVLCAFLAGTLHATTLYVPTDAAGIPDGAASTNTIANAISALGAGGGEIVIMPGEYPQTATLALDAPITLRSFSGTPSETTIAGGGSAARFCVIKAANADAVVSGLTIRNGYPSVTTEPGGVWLDGGGTLTNCWVTGNYVILNGSGGGVLNDNGRVTHCRIHGNLRAGAGKGLGLYQSGADAETVYSEICDNQCTSPVAAGISGGGVYAVGGRLHHCTITGNIASLLAGATGSHGGVYLKEATMEYCLIAGNHASSHGGVHLDNGGQITSNPTILRHCTVAGNRAKYGGGLARAGSATKNCIVENCIVWDNYATFANAAGSTDLDDVADDVIMSVTGLCAHVAIGQQALTANPVFVDPANGVYRLAENSPCRGAGTDENGYPVDLGYAPYDGAAAVPAPEYAPQSLVYVATNGTKTAPYNTPATATDDIFAALDHCGDGTVLIVSNGDYAVTGEIILDSCIANCSGGGSGFGCGYYQTGSDAVIACTSITNCYGYHSTLSGVGAYLEGGLMDRCTIVSNRIGGSSSSGSQDALYATDTTVRNTLVAQNRQDHKNCARAGVQAAANAILENCTIVSNQAYKALAVDVAGGLYFASAKVVTARNNIVYGNTCDQGATAAEYAGYRADYVTAANNCVPTRSPSIAFGSACVEADAGQPLFVAFADGDYRLARNSVCRDKGVDQEWMTGATDLAGHKRKVGTVDIGCYECGSFATVIMLRQIKETAA